MQLNFENITVQYDELLALEGLTLAVRSGEAVAVIGPSGCGKSTLLRLAAGLMQPSAGAVKAGGDVVIAPRREIALILQDYGLLPWKNVFRNAELGLRIRKVPRAERERRTQAALDQVGLGEFANAHPAELSGGMQQRLALARAIALDAQVLLMDEPLSALDAFLREELQDVLLKQWKSAGQTQILVTHSIEEAVYLGQRIVVMASRPGRVIAEIANPGMGLASYRASDEFFARCREVRAALAGAREIDAAGGVASASAAGVSASDSAAGAAVDSAPASAAGASVSDSAAGAAAGAAADSAPASVSDSAAGAAADSAADSAPASVCDSAPSEQGGAR